MALHVQWDLPNGLKDVAQVKRLAEKHGVRPGSINPNIFQDQKYKYGSLGNPDPAIRKRAWITFWIASPSPKLWAAAISRSGSPTGRTIPARRTSGTAWLV